MKNKISLNHSVVQAKGNIVSDMAGEKVMLNVNKGKYYNLGNVGGEIWEMVEEQITVKQLIDSLLSEYNVGHSECVEEVISFLDLLLAEDLIEISS
jgi:hypothetical protein